jgi:translation initiation factor IF-3
MFRGREVTYAQQGRRILDRVAADSSKVAIVEREARLEGRNMFMIISPRPEIVAAAQAAHAAKQHQPGAPAAHSSDNSAPSEPTEE